MMPMEEPLLDPKFWQALGRALGWSEMCELALSYRHGEEECKSFRGYYWVYQWHCFIQTLADGNTPDTFCAHLPSSQSRSRGTKNPPEAGRDHSLNIVFQRVQEIQQELDRIYTSAQQARTRAHIV
jgi:hypothetical protein